MNIDKSMEISVYFQCGNSEVEVEVESSSEWEKEGVKRVYYELTHSNGSPAISKLYQVVSGSTRDLTVDVGGVIFGYQLGRSSESRTKQDCAKNAIEELAKKILSVR